MFFDNGSADRQAYPEAAGVGAFRLNAWRGVTDSHKNALAMSSRPINKSRGALLNRAHGLDRIEGQIGDNLLQLTSIALADFPWSISPVWKALLG